MKCPHCGSEMVIDEHRKMALYMCYECGYIEGRNPDEEPHLYQETGLEHLQYAITEEIGAVEDSVNSLAKSLIEKAERLNLF